MGKGYHFGGAPGNSLEYEYLDKSKVHMRFQRLFGCSTGNKHEITNALTLLESQHIPETILKFW